MATDVYFGICPNVPADFKTGSPTITISSGVATFSTAQTDDLMGIGAVIDYDTDNKKTYVSGKISTSVWTVINGDGTVPSDVSGLTVNNITHPFTSFSNAVSNAPTMMGGDDLVSLDLQLHILGYCRQDSYDADVSIGTIDYNADSTHRVKFYTPYDTSTQCNFNHRVINNGTWDDTKYRLTYYSGNWDLFIIRYNENPAGRTMYTEIEGIQMYWGLVDPYDIHLIRIDGYSDSTFNISKCIGRIRTLPSTSLNIRRFFVRIQQDVGQSFQDSVYNIYNNVVYFDTTYASKFFLCPLFFGDPPAATMNAYENIFINFSTPAISANDGNLQVWNVKNNAFINNSNNALKILHGEWSNNIWSGSTTGMSDDIQTTQTESQLFTSAAGAETTWNFMPKEGSDLIDAGARLADLTPDVSGDMDNPSGLRPFGAGWDVGALENQSSSEVLPIIRRRRHIVNSGF